MFMAVTLFTNSTAHAPPPHTTDTMAGLGGPNLNVVIRYPPLLLEPTSKRPCKQRRCRTVAGSHCHEPFSRLF